MKRYNPFEIETPERHPLLRNRGLGSPSSPLTPRNYNSTPRANAVPRGLAGSNLPERFNAAGRRMYRRAIRGFQSMHRARGGMRTLAATARRRLFGTPLAGARAAGVVTAGEALVIYASFFTAISWVMFAIGADKFIAKHTNWQDFSNDPDDVPKDKQDNDHPNSMVGTGDPVAPCMPTAEYPNAFTVAFGAPIAVAA